MQFDPEDFVTYRGKALHRSIVQEKIGSLGWSPEQTVQLTDEQVRIVMDQRCSPDQVDIQYTEHGSHVVRIGKDGEVPQTQYPSSEINTPGLSLEEATKPPLPGTRLTNVRPPASATPVMQQSEDDSPIIGRRTIKPEPAPEPPPPPPPQTMPVSIPAPATDWRQVIALLDAVVALASLETNYKQASALCSAHSLWDALETYDYSAWDTLGGSSFKNPNLEDDTCVGGTILKCEVANGAIHILTTKGTLSLTGKSINLVKQEI